MPARTATDALTGAAQAIHDEARAHKSAEYAHRKKARQLQRKLDELRADCARLGIEIRIETTTQTPGGPQS